MQDRWVGKGVNLELLSEHLEQFFNSKDFLTNVSKSSDGYKIVAVPKFTNDLCEHVKVFIRGEPNDCLINFAAGSRSRFFVKVGRLTTFFGGGIFVLRGLKSLEELEKLEREFWKFVDEQIDLLSHK